MNYKDAQVAVFKYLLARHQENPGFRFSLRNNFATDGSSGLFIGTDKKTSYFGFTLWYIPLFLKGATGDLLDYAVEWSPNKQSVRLVLQYLISKEAEGEQNKASLALEPALLNHLPAIAWQPIKEFNKLARLHYVAHEDITTVSELVEKLDELIGETLLGVDAAIEEVKQDLPAWEAGHYGEAHFNQMLTRVYKMKG